MKAIRHLAFNTFRGDNLLRSPALTVLYRKSYRPDNEGAIALTLTVATCASTSSAERRSRALARGLQSLQAAMLRSTRCFFIGHICAYMKNAECSPPLVRREKCRQVNAQYIPHQRHILITPLVRRFLAIPHSLMSV